MGLFIFAVIIAIIGVLVAVFARLISEESPALVVVGGVLVVGFAFVLFVVSGLKSVPVKNVGVAQSFGAVSGTVYGPGIHQTWTPWLHLTDINETVQTTTFEGKDCLQVRVGGQQSACADVTIQWQILPAAASSLFSDYANSGDLMQTVENAVVIRELKQVVNNTIGDYNPITDVQSVTGTATATSQFTGFGPAILTTMRGDIGQRVRVLTVLMPFVHYSDTVEAKLNQIQQAYANFAIAQENVKVNQEQAQAYGKLGNPTLNQLISECLTSTVQRPVGFQCFPGAGNGLALSGKN
jgi:SPFH domain / Band 7 family